jgi:hypothetical protein
MNSLYYKLLEKQKFAEFLPGRLINRSHELISLDVQLAHNHFHNETFTVFVDILKNLQSTSCEMVECLRRNKETMSFVSVDQYVLSDLNASAARTCYSCEQLLEFIGANGSDRAIGVPVAMNSHNDDNHHSAAGARNLNVYRMDRWSRPVSGLQSSVSHSCANICALSVLLKYASISVDTISCFKGALSS